MTFNGKSSTNETSYSWNLDIKPATGAIVTADYSSFPGDHLVFLIVKGRGGTSDPAFATVHCP